MTFWPYQHPETVTYFAVDPLLTVPLGWLMHEGPVALRGRPKMN